MPLFVGGVGGGYEKLCKEFVAVARSVGFWVLGIYSVTSIFGRQEVHLCSIVARVISLMLVFIELVFAEIDDAGTEVGVKSPEHAKKRVHGRAECLAYQNIINIQCFA